MVSMFYIVYNYSWYILTPPLKYALSNFPSITQLFFLVSFPPSFFFLLMNIDFLYSVLSAKDIKRNITCFLLSEILQPF